MKSKRKIKTPKLSNSLNRSLRSTHTQVSALKLKKLAVGKIGSWKQQATRTSNKQVIPYSRVVALLRCRLSLVGAGVRCSLFDVRCSLSTIGRHSKKVASASASRVTGCHDSHLLAIFLFLIALRDRDRRGRRGYLHPALAMCVSLRLFPSFSFFSLSVLLA